MPAAAAGSNGAAGPVPQVLVAAGGAEWESGTLPLLTAPGAPVRLARRCVDVPDLVAAAAAGRAGLALVAASLAGWDADVVARLAECDVRTLVVADGGVEAERCLRLGADAVLHVEEADPPALLRALQAVHAATISTSQTVGGVDQGLTAPSDVAVPGRHPAQPGSVVAVWGPTGAPGRSTVALGLAAAAAARRIPTLLVDADVYGGATAQMLAVLDEVSGVLAAARAASSGTLDPTVLAGAAREVAPGLRVLTGLPRADRWTALRPPAARELLSTARRMAALVVVDCGFCLEQDEELSFDTTAPRRNGATTTVVEDADLVLTVGSADPLGLARLARARSDLRELVPTAAVRLVVNRVRTGSGWSREDVSATLLRAIGEVPLGFLPLDQPAVDKAWVAGRSVPEAAAGSPLGRALDVLAADLARDLGLASAVRGRAHRRARRRGALAAAVRR